MLSYLCKVAGVSCSGYYNFFSQSSQESRKQRELLDEKTKKIILEAYKFKGRMKGARQIKMTLEGHFGTVYNLKRIRRIMKKYEIICPIRKANPYSSLSLDIAIDTILKLMNNNIKGCLNNNFHISLWSAPLQACVT